MKTWTLGILGVLAVAMLSGCELIGFKNWEWHQKITVEVVGPSGLITSDSVIEVRCGTSPDWLGGGGMGCQVKGEAVAMEIAPGQVLFALLKGDPESQNYPAKVAYQVFFPNRKLTTVEERGDLLEREFRGDRRDLPRQNYPLLVTFTDINDPKTIQRVDPDDFGAAFGPGIWLKHITLEITDEPVTEGKIESVLGWFLNYVKNGYRVNGVKCVACPVSSHNLADLIGTGEFKTGGKK